MNFDYLTGKTDYSAQLDERVMDFRLKTKIFRTGQTFEEWVVPQKKSGFIWSNFKKSYLINKMAASNGTAYSKVSYLAFTGDKQAMAFWKITGETHRNIGQK